MIKLSSRRLNNFLSDPTGLIQMKMRFYALSLKKIISTSICACLCVIKGIQIGSECAFYGIPLFVRVPHSRIIIGRGVTFRSDSTSNLIGVNHRCVISALYENAVIEIGDRAGFSGVTIGCAKRVTICEEVMCGANVIITDTDWHNMNPSLRNKPFVESAKAVWIGKNVFIGASSMILKGVSIGENSVIGAGSVVTKDIPGNVIAGGNPCRVLKSL